MNMLGLLKTLSTFLLALATTLTGIASTASFAGRDVGAGLSVCADVNHCRIVTSVDVDGDQRPDQVGWRQLSQGYVQIRVGTATGKLLLRRVDVHLWWGGGAWAGAARVDGSPGAELMVGSAQGAHTPMYTMVTYRLGALVVELSPSPLSNKWLVDASWGDFMGWQRHLIDGHAAMTQRIVVRVDGGERFTGHRVTYVWTAGHWVRTTKVAISFSTERAASEIAGFHVAGLDTFPGIG